MRSVRTSPAAGILLRVDWELEFGANSFIAAATNNGMFVAYSRELFGNEAKVDLGTSVGIRDSPLLKAVYMLGLEKRGRAGVGHAW